MATSPVESFGNSYTCGTCDATFRSIGRQRIHVQQKNHTIPTTQGPVTVRLTLNLHQQTIRCPVCPHKSRDVKTERGFLTHFKRQHPQYELNIAFHCSVCDLSLRNDEKQAHLEAHRQQRLPLTPAQPANRPSTAALS